MARPAPATNQSVISGGGAMGELIRQRTEWPESLGSPSAWPQSLRTVLQLMLTSRYAMWLGWGPELHFFYNDAYRVQTLGKKHPWALARRAEQVWAEIWDTLSPRIDQVMATGEATWDEGLLLFLERSGFPEETYHTFSYSPAYDDSGNIGGLFCVVVEETDRLIGERRLRLLGDFAARVTTATTIQDALRGLEACLTEEPREFPFSLVYLFDSDASHLVRMAHSGIAADHVAAPQTIDPQLAGGPWASEDLSRLNRVRVLALDPNYEWPNSVWGKPPTHAMCVPITRAGTDRPEGVFIAGLNPYRPLDASAESFGALFVGQLGASIANARAYEEERKRAEALAAIDRAKTEFFSNVSHEFRTPLTLILGPMENALASNGAGLAGENLRVAHRNALRLLKLVNSLLDFSRIEAGRAEAAYAPTDLAQLTAELASVFRSAIERAGLRFNVEVPVESVTVYVDTEMWEKIVLNLLSNALKFTFDGSIRISLLAGQDGVVLSVQDTGIGIPATALPHLFERFHRVRGAKARTHEGSGIGLALVAELVKLHGGQIQVESVEAKGTRFEVQLPYGKAHLAPERVLEERAHAGFSRGVQPYVQEALRWSPQADATEPDSQPSAGRARRTASRAA